ncbi:cation:proton antiporter [Candidatus Bathyarchaeota archaeon]|nr:MAG: cation:proton antiporter [Candidatus Hecatellales archaeon]RLI34621.1 MAG: cation:proton antiporter [Candidatus Bathyarchaeota archaeon]
MKGRKPQEGMTLIVKTVSRILAPVMLLLSAYIVLHGHLTHGGGFQGGVLIACALVLLLLAFGVDYVEGKVSFSFGQVFRSLGATIILITALLGMAFGFWFFKNVGVYPYGFPGGIFSAGSLLLYNIGEMANVSASFLVAFYFLVKFRRRKR